LESSEVFGKNLKQVLLNKIQGEFENATELFQKDKINHKQLLIDVISLIGNLWRRKIVSNGVFSGIIKSVIQDVDIIFNIYTKFGKFMVTQMAKEVDSHFEMLGKLEKVSLEDSKLIQKLKNFKKNNFVKPQNKK
jgi:ascorbate-specific PTS system EIIC-type component UlaA